MAEILDFNFYRKFGVILPMRPSEIKNEEENQALKNSKTM